MSPKDQFYFTRKILSVDADFIAARRHGEEETESDRDEESSAFVAADLAWANEAIKVGMRVTGGAGADKDFGRVDEINGQMATVSWESGVVTPCPISHLTVA